MTPSHRHRPIAAWLLVALIAGCGGKAAPPTPPRNTPTGPAAPTATPAPVDAFAAEAAAAGFVYQPPAGFVVTPVTENRDVFVSHAVASADHRIELRFALRPYPADLAPAMRSRQFSSTFFLTAILNLTRGGSSGEAAAAEPVPAADWAADEATMTMIRWFDVAGPADAFGTGFAFAAVLYLHRDGVGDGYLFVMLKDREALAQMTEEAFHALRFAPR